MAQEIICREINACSGGECNQSVNMEGKHRMVMKLDDLKLDLKI